MSLCTWDPTLATGISSIDGQHQYLFALVQGLYDAYRSGKGREVVPETLDELVAYCLTHFADEESHMNRARFPDLPFHHAEHQRLMAKVHHLQDQLANGEPQLAMDLSILLSQWLRTHIREHDLAFADFLRERVPPPGGW